MTQPAVTLPYVFASESGNQPAGQLDANFNALANLVNGAYMQTAAEALASVTPSNYSYAPGNVIRYGADSTGIADSTAAIQQAVMVDQAVYFPAGTYNVSSMITLTIPYQRLYGDGLLSTIFATAGFNLAQQGVFNFTAGGNDDGPWFENLHFSCDQSVVASSGNRSNLVQYPALLFMRNAPRFRVINCKVEHFLIFCDMQGLSSGAVFDGVDCGIYLYGVVINGSGDTIRFKDFHGVTGFNSWTSNQRAIAGDGNLTWIPTGRNDGMDLSDCLFLGPCTAVNSFHGSGTNFGTAQGGYANTYAGSGFLTGYTAATQFVNCGFDTGATILQQATGSWMLLSNCYWSVPASPGTISYITMSAGEIDIQNNWFNLSGPPTVSLINLNNASTQFMWLSIKGCHFNLAPPTGPIPGYTLLYAAGTNAAGPIELIVTDNEFVTPNVANTSPLIQTVGNGVNITLNSNRWGANTNSPTALSIDTDNYHIITDNSFNGWGISLPAAYALATVSHNSPRGTVGFNAQNTQYLYCTNGASTVATSATVYLGPGSYQAPGNAANNFVFNAPGTITGFAVTTDINPGAGTFTYTIYKNTVATSMTGQLTGTNFKLAVNTNAFSVAQNDYITVQLVTASGGVGDHKICIAFEPA